MRDIYEVLRKKQAEQAAALEALQRFDEMLGEEPMAADDAADR